MVTRDSRFSTMWPFTFGSNRVRFRASVLAMNRSPLVGRTATARFSVPSRGKYRDTVIDCTSISATSLSGIVYLMTDGFHCVLVASTISPTCGGAGRLVFVGGGCGGARFAGMIVVRFPDSANATYTLLPLGLTAIA